MQRWACWPPRRRARWSSSAPEPTSYAAARSRRVQPWQRSAAAAVEGGPAVLSARRAARARYLLGGAFRGRVRRPLLLASGGAALDVAEAVRAAAPSQTARAPDLLLDGLAQVDRSGLHSRGAIAHQAVSAFRGQVVSREGVWPGSGRAPRGRGFCRTTRAGTCCPPAGPSSPAMPARSLRCPSPTTHA